MRGEKGQKMTQDDKKVALYISGTIYHMLFMVHMSKMMISPGVFFFISFFENFDLWVQ